MVDDYLVGAGHSVHEHGAAVAGERNTAVVMRGGMPDLGLRVRYAVLDLEGGDRTGLPAGQFPPEAVSDTNYYLTGAPGA